MNIVIKSDFYPCPIEPLHHCPYSKFDYNKDNNVISITCKNKCNLKNEKIKGDD